MLSLLFRLAENESIEHGGLFFAVNRVSEEVSRALEHLWRFHRLEVEVQDHFSEFTDQKIFNQTSRSQLIIDLICQDIIYSKVVSAQMLKPNVKTCVTE